MIKALKNLLYSMTSVGRTQASKIEDFILYTLYIIRHSEFGLLYLELHCISKTKILSSFIPFFLEELRGEIAQSTVFTLTLATTAFGPHLKFRH